ncbi:MAG: amidase [Ilumatobacteraceae bacterium]
MTELWRRSALELADAIRNGETSSREVLDDLVTRVAKVNDRLNAIVALLGEEAEKAAAAADQAVADGVELGPLHGVPITVKENIDLAGWPTTQGVPALGDAVVTLDAPNVERMRDAGAIPFARTNLPDLGLRVHTDSSLHGLTRNPWNPGLTAGGSSGGEASALAAGMSPLGLGNDLGGSLRNPAHCCGIASLKPSTGVVPHASALPPEDPLIMFQLMAVEGPMARRVADVRAALLALAGAHPRDPLSLPVVLQSPRTGERFRVAVCTDPPGGTTDAGIAAGVRRAADALSDAGHEVVDAVPVTYARSIELWAELLMPDIRGVRPIFDSVMGPDAKTFLDFAATEYPPIDTAAWGALFAERHGAAREWSSFFERWDVLLTPTWAQPAFPHGADIVSLEAARATLDTMRPVLPANLLGLPAAVVPAGLADGMPVGAQLTGTRFADLVVLDVAQAIEDALGVLTPIDPVTAT